jgi:hypothetical protein
VKTNSQKKQEYIIRHIEESDYQEVNNAFNEFTGRSRTVEQWLWQWLHTPFEPSESWVIEHVASREIVGHHGVMCLPFSENGKSIIVGKTENTFVLTDHAKKLYYPRFEKAALNDMKDRFIYIYTTNPDAGKGAVGILRKRLGYAAVGRKVCFCLYASRIAIKKLVPQRFPYLKSAAGLLSAIHFASQRVVQKTSYLQVRMVNVTSLPWNHINEVEKFWQDHSRFYGITADRTAAYLKWRFVENPYAKHYLIRLRKENQILGYAVLKNLRVTIGGVDFNSTIIDDLIVANACEENFYAALAALTRYSSTGEVVLFFTLMQNDAVNRAIQRFLGPLRKWHAKESDDILVWGNSKQNSSWYFTNILSEGVTSDGNHKI